MTEIEILIRIAQLQFVQKTNPPTSAEWQAASAELQPLFAAMAQLQNKCEVQS